MAEIPHLDPDDPQGPVPPCTSTTRITASSSPDDEVDDVVGQRLPQSGELRGGQPHGRQEDPGLPDGDDAVVNGRRQGQLQADAGPRRIPVVERA